MDHEESRSDAGVQLGTDTKPNHRGISDSFRREHRSCVGSDGGKKNGERRGQERLNEELYPSGVACVRQTDWCRPGGNPGGTQCEPGGLVRRGGAGGSGSGSGRSGVQSGEGEHTQDLKTRE